MTTDLHDFRLVTASAYPGMMAPLNRHPSCICVLSGDADQRTGTDAPAALSLEGLDGVRRRWRFGDVARLADFVPKVLAGAPADDRPVLLIPPRASLAWQAAATAWPGRVRLAASPMAVAEPIAEDKIGVRRALRGLGLPVPDDLILAPSELDFATIALRLGEPFVLQAPSGAGGQGTYLVESPVDIARALTTQPHVRQWLASRFAGQLTINAAGVVYADGVRLLPVSIQSSGIGELGFGFGAYCGSEFGGSGVPTGVVRQAREHAAVVGEWLRGLGHRGLYGVDIAVDGDRTSLLEINPRIQGSSWLLSTLQQEPCLYSHVEALLGRPLGAPLVGPESVAEAGHLLLRWDRPAGVVHDLPQADGHRLDSGTAVRITGLPEVGVTLLPGAILARLNAGEALAAPGGHSLRPDARRVVESVKNGFDITTAPPGAPYAG